MNLLRAIAVRALVIAALLAAVIGVLLIRDRPDGAADAPDAAAPSDAATIERGRYLALVGNCRACHTARGGEPYAGGRAIATPFGDVYTSNLTPDAATGLGGWTRAQFREAMRHGRSRDGRLLIPAFPYDWTTRVPLDDVDAIYAYLQSLPPVVNAPRPHALRFPFGTQPALAVWRALYFRPGEDPPDPSRSAAWNRGRDLVRGLAHCGACHAPRNALGASADTLGGARMPDGRWYAPALDRASEAGVANWPAEDVARLLRTGVSPRGAVLGPMAEVVFNSLQHLSTADALAIGEYLRTLPQRVEKPRADVPPPDGARVARGGKLYEHHCADCHGAQGQGHAGAYPALAGNRVVTMDSPVNLVRAIVAGGFAPATAGNPRPYGMPPFGQVLNAGELEDLVAFLRASWGHRATPVSAVELMNAR